MLTSAMGSICDSMRVLLLNDADPDRTGWGGVALATEVLGHVGGARCHRGRRHCWLLVRSARWSCGGRCNAAEPGLLERASRTLPLGPPFDHASTRERRQSPPAALPADPVPVAGRGVRRRCTSSFVPTGALIPFLNLGNTPVIVFFLRGSEMCPGTTRKPGNSASGLTRSASVHALGSGAGPTGSAPGVRGRPDGACGRCRSSTGHGEDLNGVDLPSALSASRLAPRSFGPMRSYGRGYGRAQPRSIDPRHRLASSGERYRAQIVGRPGRAPAALAPWPAQTRLAGEFERVARPGRTVRVRTRRSTLHPASAWRRRSGNVFAEAMASGLPSSAAWLAGIPTVATCSEWTAGPRDPCCGCNPAPG